VVLGVFLNFFWLWHFVKHVVDLLVCICHLQVDLLISALGFMLMNLMCVAAINKKIQ
jgi:hypothetical protein